MIIRRNKNIICPLNRSDIKDGFRLAFFVLVRMFQLVTVIIMDIDESSHAINSHEVGNNDE